jgi:hypothetical protein
MIIIRINNMEERGYRDAMKFLMRIGAVDWLKLNEPWKLKGQPKVICDLANRFMEEGIKNRVMFESLYGSTRSSDPGEVRMGRPKE